LFFFTFFFGASFVFLYLLLAVRTHGISGSWNGNGARLVSKKKWCVYMSISLEMEELVLWAMFGFHPQILFTKRQKYAWSTKRSLFAKLFYG